MLIASNDAAAAQLSAELGESCVTLEGLVSRPGAISGGWLGEGLSQSERLLLRKLDYQVAEEELAEAQADLKWWSSLLHRAQDAESRHHEGKASLDISMFECEQISGQLNGAQQKVHSLEAERAQMFGNLNASRQESALCRQALIEAKSSSEKCLSPVVVSIGAELESASDVLEKLRSQLSEVKDGIEDAEEGLEEISFILQSLNPKMNAVMKKKGTCADSCLAAEEEEDDSMMKFNVQGGNSSHNIPLLTRLDLHIQKMREGLQIAEGGLQKLVMEFEAEQETGKTAVR
jgi:chromosome segregation ATPase